MAAIVEIVTPPHGWRGTPQADAIHQAVAAAGLTYLTHRQVDTILDGLHAGGYLADDLDPDAAAVLIQTVDQHQRTRDQTGSG